jgi:hypothetical protein
MPCCAGCGAKARAATFGFYDFWPEGRLPETAFFDICRSCATALFSRGPEGAHLRHVLTVLGSYTAMQKSVDRESRSIESVEQQPRQGAK